MQLTDEQLRELYFGLVKPFQHPDPLGFMTRALLLSEGDPDFVDGDNRGFLPLVSGYAIEQTGVPEIQSLDNNVIAALSLDRIHFDQYKNVDDMVIATHHEGEVTPGVYTKEQTEFLEAIEETRAELVDVLEPPLATVEDVIKLINSNQDGFGMSNKQFDFFCFLLENKV